MLKQFYKGGLLLSMVLISCNNGPKVITTPLDKDEITNGGMFTEDNSNDLNITSSNSYLADDLHTIVINEVLPTSKYIFAHVTEGDEQYWIAAINKDLSVGNIYFYRTGLLKTNYESKDLNRVFDKIYLISNSVAEDHKNNSGFDTGNLSSKNINSRMEKTDIKPLEGSIKIEEIVANPKKFSGKTVQITGRCVKINPNIMERNWIHLQDGSQDDYDLVVTSNTFVNEGEIITIRATVTLNKDFGAGYSYSLILEDGTLVK